MSIEEYLLWIRDKIGPEVYIIVPDTKAYQDVLMKLKDEYIIHKQPNMDLTKYSRVIKKK
jgi:hypothetical protein